MADAKQVGFLFAGVRHPETDEPLANGAVWTYEEGSTTLSNLYTARDTTEGQHENPLTLDAFGRAEAFGNGVYRFVIRDSDDDSGDILYEIDGVELKAQITDDSIGPLTSDLDFNGNKGINLAAGTAPADAVNKQQLDTVQSNLESGIADVQTNLDNHTFIDLADTDPISYSGESGKLVAVNSAEDGLEFISKDAVNQDGTFLDNSDTPTNYTGSDGKAPLVNESAGALEFGYPDAKTIQGVDVDATTPTDGQVLEYDSTSSSYVPTTPASPSALVRTEAFSGNSNNVTITQGVDFTGTPLFFAVRFDIAGEIVVMFDAQQAKDLGYFRAWNRGGENADRNYDYTLLVSESGGAWTFSGRYVKNIAVYTV
jgi:hypothetical protein